MERKLEYHRLIHFIACLLPLLGFVLGGGLFSCTKANSLVVDELNDKAYASHYRNLDSVIFYAQEAIKNAHGYDAGRAEAQNNLAFVNLMEMNYKEAYARLDTVERTTDNQVELLIADIQLMRLCQRESHNKEFYDHFESAQKRLHRIKQDEHLLSERLKRRMVYARTEFAIVTSTYYYYVGLEQPSIQALNQINPDGDIQTDLPQFLSYLYNIGAGGIITKGSQNDIYQKEFDYLVRCYMLARLRGFPYWEANALQALSSHLIDPHSRELLMKENLPSFKFINTDQVPDSLLAGNLAERSLHLFQTYGDVYQIAGSYRTLASCFWQINDYKSALICLKNALYQNPAIQQAPDLVASIREQLCVVYSALNNKQESDYNRNIYLDLQDETRQDRYLASRAEQLNFTSQQLNLIIMAMGLLIIVVLSLLFVFHYLRRRSDKKSSLDSLLAPLEQWKHNNEAYMAELAEKYDEVQEQLDLNKLHLSENKRKNLEQRAKISLVNGVMPLIDRMLHEIERLKLGGESEAVTAERYTYIAELTDKINEQNNVLTEWIQIRQGKLSLHIESFAVQQIFDIVRKGRTGFQMKGVQLEVIQTDAVVKADRVLTLFMVNTLADNARKFTPSGGKVRIEATETDQYVEIGVTDNGSGLTTEQQANIFVRKPSTDPENGQSHGFGLMNCNGIINKYKKISQIFSVCSLGVESETGKGSRFFFRLPKGMARIIVTLLVGATSLLSAHALRLHANDKAVAQANNDYMTLAAIYADSAYYANINGSYAKTLAFADTSRFYLNKQYKQLRPQGKQMMQRLGSLSTVPAEIKWFHDSIPMNYDIILDIRNESAVAALALHRWDLYRYNNSVYTHLFKEQSADRSLGEYCRMMMRSETNKNVAIAIMVLLLLSIFPVYYVMYYRHRLAYQFYLERLKQLNGVLLSNSSVEEKLKAVKKLPLDRFPERLQDIVIQIKEALEKSQTESERSHTDIELLEDEVHRVEYESERIYISNAILDNCLSTLKHETMYYPSRIRQLLETNERQLEAIDELAIYYKELYEILSRQAMGQVKAIKLVAHVCDMRQIVGQEKVIFQQKTVPLLMIDPIMLLFLVDTLYKINSNSPLKVVAVERQQQYVELQFVLSQLSHTEQECRNLFAPSAKGLAFFICRQIARDNGETTNKRLCGIKAHATEEGTRIEVVLSKAN